MEQYRGSRYLFAVRIRRGGVDTQWMCYDNPDRLGAGRDKNNEPARTGGRACVELVAKVTGKGGKLDRIV